MRVCIASEFTKYPGPRYQRDGKYSAEEFRRVLLAPRFVEAKSKGERLLVDLDGVYGYATSFLEEAFGGLAREHGIKSVLDVLEFKTADEAYLVDDILRYIREAHTGATKTGS